MQIFPKPSSSLSSVQIQSSAKSLYSSSSSSSTSLSTSGQSSDSNSTVDNNKCDDYNKNNINNNEADMDINIVRERKEPDLLKPYLPASDPNYKNVGPIGISDFIIRREGEPTADELTNENILKIVKIQCTDLEVNTLVWKCLGYRFMNGQWKSDNVFPKWKEQYPDTPPDLVGMQRIYTPEIDKVSLKANQALVKSVPVQSKQSLKFHLKPLGFKGYQYSELTPNKTRRAQCANWLLYYREELFGYTIEQLLERKRQRQQPSEQEQEQSRSTLPQQQQSQKKQNEGIDNATVSSSSSSSSAAETWTPPVREVL